MTRRSITSTLAAVAAAMLLAPLSAHAAGQLSYDGCLGDDASDNCVDVPGRPFHEPSGVAVSGDGRSVYLASNGGDSVAHFFRGGADGQISYDGCLSDTDVFGCGVIPSDTMAGARGVAVSPDGKSVYIASHAADAIAHFARTGPDGQLEYRACWSNTGADGCFDLPQAPIDAASGIAVSPDGRSVYVASQNSHSVAHLFRNTTSGALAWDGCLNSAGTQNCGDVPGDGTLDAATSVAVSPDGSSVYVASFNGDTVAHLKRSAAGQLTWDKCHSDGGASSCKDLPGNAQLDGANAVAVSPDGRSVYVAGFSQSTIAHLFRAADGELTFDGCLNDGGTTGCGDLPEAPLSGPRSITVSPDGKSVYVAAHTANAVGHFFRGGPDGQISWDGCLNNDGSQNCGDLPFEPLRGAASVAVSPDGKSVYVASVFSSSVAHFFRARDPEPQPENPQPQPEQPRPEPEQPQPEQPQPEPKDTVAPAIRGLRVTNRRFRAGRTATARAAARRTPVGTTFRYALSEAATVTVVIERATAGRRVGGSCRKPSRKLGRRPRCTRFVRTVTLTRAGSAGLNQLRFSGRVGKRSLEPGSYRAAFTAADGSGNRSTPVTARFAVVRGTR